MRCHVIADWDIPQGHYLRKVLTDNGQDSRKANVNQHSAVHDACR
jgi:hypothetical protein